MRVVGKCGGLSRNVRSCGGQACRPLLRRYRAPRPEGDISAETETRLEEKLSKWEAFDGIPGERIPDGNKTIQAHRYGMIVDVGLGWLGVLSDGTPRLRNRRTQC